MAKEVPDIDITVPSINKLSDEPTMARTETFVDPFEGAEEGELLEGEPTGSVEDTKTFDIAKKKAETEDFIETKTFGEPVARELKTGSEGTEADRLKGEGKGLSADTKKAIAEASAFVKEQAKKNAMVIRKNAEATRQKNIESFGELTPLPPSEQAQGEIRSFVETASVEDVQEELMALSEEIDFYTESPVSSDLRKTRIQEIMWEMQQLQDAVAAKRKAENQPPQAYDKETGKPVSTENVARAEASIEAAAALKADLKAEGVEANPRKEINPNDVFGASVVETAPETGAALREHSEIMQSVFDHFSETSLEDLQDVIEENLILAEKSTDAALKKMAEESVQTIRERLAKERNVYLDSEGTVLEKVPEDLQAFVEEGATVEKDIDIVGQIGAQETVEAFKEIDDKFGASLVDAAGDMQGKIADGEVAISEKDRYGLPDKVPDAIAGTIAQVAEAVQEEAGKVDIAEGVMAQVAENREPETAPVPEIPTIPPTRLRERVRASEVRRQQAEKESANVQEAQESRERLYGGFENAEEQQHAQELAQEAQNLKKDFETGNISADYWNTERRRLAKEMRALLAPAAEPAPESSPGPEAVEEVKEMLDFAKRFDSGERNINIPLKLTGELKKIIDARYTLMGKQSNLGAENQPISLRYIGQSADGKYQFIDQNAVKMPNGSDYKIALTKEQVTDLQKEAENLQTYNVAGTRTPLKNAAA